MYFDVGCWLFVMCIDMEVGYGSFVYLIVVVWKFGMWNLLLIFEVIDVVGVVWEKVV